MIPHAGFRGFALGNGSRNTALAQGTQAKVLKGASITIEGPINKKLWICNDRFGLQTDCHCDDISIGLRCLGGHPRQQLHILRQLHRVEWQSQDPKGRCHLKKPRLCHFFFLFFLLLLDLSLNFWQISIFLMFFGTPSKLNICGRKSDWNSWKINVVNTSHAPYGTLMNLGSHVVPVLRTSDGPMRYIVAMEISQAFQDGPAAKHAALRQGATKNPKQEIPNVA